VRLALDFLRGFYEFGASRLAFREQPLPSKPVIPVWGTFPMLGTFSLQRNGKIPFLYYIMQIQDTIIRLIGFLGFAVKEAGFWGVRAYALTPQNPGTYPGNSQRAA
jgi:hypothetical protein